MEELEKRAQQSMQALIIAVFVLLVFDLSLIEQKVGFKLTQESLEALESACVPEYVISDLKKVPKLKDLQTEREFKNQLIRFLSPVDFSKFTSKVLDYTQEADIDTQVQFFGTKLPSRSTPLVLLLCMAVTLAYLASTCNALREKLRGSPSVEKIGSWLFFHPWRGAPILAGLWLFSAPTIHVITFAIIQSKFRGLPWDVYLTELLLFVTLTTLSGWCFHQAMVTRKKYLSLCTAGNSSNDD